MNQISRLRSATGFGRWQLQTRLEGPTLSPEPNSIGLVSEKEHCLCFVDGTEHALVHDSLILILFDQMRYELVHKMMSRSLLELDSMLPWTTAVVVVLSGAGSLLGLCAGSLLREYLTSFFVHC